MLNIIKSLLVVIAIVLLPIWQGPLLEVTLIWYLVFWLRPVMVHGLVVHSLQPDDGGLHSTLVTMSVLVLDEIHCKVTSQDITVALTFKSIGLVLTMNGKS